MSDEAAWSDFSLPEVLDFKEGPGILAKDFRSEGVPLIRLAGLKYGADLLEGCNYLDPDMVTSKWSHFQIAPGDVLLSTSASLGEVAIVGEEAAGAIPYTGIIRFRPRDSELLDSRFIRYVLESPQFKTQVEAMGVGSVMRHFGPSHLKHMAMPLPPVTVQRSIADVLCALDDKIAANRKLAEVAESLLAARFVSLEFDSDSGDQVPLSEYFVLNPTCARPSSSEPVYVDMQKLPTASLLVSEWDHRAARGGARFMNGDTLLARITPCLENRKVGYVDFLDDQEVAIGSTEYIVIRSRPGVPWELGFFLATSPRFRLNAIQHMVGTSGRQRLSATDVAQFTVRRVDPRLLEEWGQIATPLVQELGALRDESRTLAALRDTLLPRLMSGELRVKDAEAVAADAV